MGESSANAGKRDRLERTRWMWLKNWVNWTEKEAPKRESMALERCVTGMAYEIKLVLQSIYDAEGCRGGQEPFLRLVCVGSGNAATERGDAPTNSRAARIIKEHSREISAS